MTSLLLVAAALALLISLPAGRRAVESHYNWDRVARDLRIIGHELGASAKQVAG